jgi:transposase InsO family protein
MELRLHANARTTPKTRAYIQASTAPAAELAEELRVSETTIRRWRPRDSVRDRSSAPKRQAISLSALEETLVRELRSELALSLDDIAEVMRRCVNPKLSRSAIHRSLVRQGLNRRTKPAKKEAGVFEEAGVGFIHVDLKHLPRLRGAPSYVFAAIDRATRFVHVDVIARRDGETIAACLKRFIEAFPHPVHIVLTDNGSEFTDRFAVDMRTKPHDKPSGRHPFDRICAEAGIEHRLTRPFRPQTNGMVERFNKRLAEALRQATAAERNGGKNRFETHAQRNAFIHRFADAYNRTRLKCLGYRAPLQALDNLTEHDTSAGVLVCTQHEELRVGVHTAVEAGPGKKRAGATNCRRVRVRAAAHR